MTGVPRDGNPDLEYPEIRVMASRQSLGTRASCFARLDGGGAMIEFAVIAPVLVLLAIGVADFGRAFYTGIVIASAVRASAQYGAQDVLTATDNAGMIQVARDDAGDPTLNVTPTNYCRCPDGTDPGGCSAPATCPGYGDPRVFVKVKAVKGVGFIFRYPGIPDSVYFRDSATFRAN